MLNISNENVFFFDLLMRPALLSFEIIEFCLLLLILLFIQEDLYVVLILNQLGILKILRSLQKHRELPLENVSFILNNNIPCTLLDHFVFSRVKFQLILAHFFAQFQLLEVHSLEKLCSFFNHNFLMSYLHVSLCQRFLEFVVILTRLLNYKP
jgi:hypothetical protein